MTRQHPNTNDTADFNKQLISMLPRLRVYALALTRDRSSADDLVHDTAIKALVGQKSFAPGTNLAAWLFRIQRNEFISGLRRARPSAPIDSAVAEALSHPPRQENGLIMREFMSAFSKLARTQREALLLSILDGQSYEAIAAHTGVSMGTVKSRVCRARDKLESLLLDDEAPSARSPREIAGDERAVGPDEHRALGSSEESVR